MIRRKAERGLTGFGKSGRGGARPTEASVEAGFGELQHLRPRELSLPLMEAEAKCVDDFPFTGTFCQLVGDRLGLMMPTEIKSSQS